MAFVLLVRYMGTHCIPQSALRRSVGCDIKSMTQLFTPFSTISRPRIRFLEHVLILSRQKKRFFKKACMYLLLSSYLIKVHVCIILLQNFRPVRSYQDHIYNIKHHFTKFRSKCLVCMLICPCTSIKQLRVTQVLVRNLGNKM